MKEELISKKEILDITKISYGQLYRWKRKGLIPEKWFIKKPSYTGQETFFPKNKIIDRINKIIELKDDMSLDELAKMFSSKLNINKLDIEEIIKKEIISKQFMQLYKELFQKYEIYKFKDVLFLYILEEKLTSGVATLEEMENIIKTIDENYINLRNSNGKVFLIRKLGISFCVGVYGEEIFIDKKSKIIFCIDINKTIEEIKFKLLV